MVHIVPDSGDRVSASSPGARPLAKTDRSLLKSPFLLRQSMLRPTLASFSDQAGGVG